MTWGLKFLKFVFTWIERGNFLLSDTKYLLLFDTKYLLSKVFRLLLMNFLLFWIYFLFKFCWVFNFIKNGYYRKFPPPINSITRASTDQALSHLPSLSSALTRSCTIHSSIPRHSGSHCSCWDWEHCQNVPCGVGSSCSFRRRLFACDSSFNSNRQLMQWEAACLFEMASERLNWSILPIYLFE